MAGNACCNLIGDADVIRAGIETKAVVPVTDTTTATIIGTAAERTRCDDEGQELLDPDIETHHALVTRLKGRADG